MPKKRLFMVAIIVGVIALALGSKSAKAAQAQQPSLDFYSVVEQSSTFKAPPSASAAGKCKGPNAQAVEPEWQWPASNSLSQYVHWIGVRLNDDHDYPAGPRESVFTRTKYSVCNPTQIITDCRGKWEQLKQAARDATAAGVPTTPNIDDLQEYAVMRFGRYRFEWIICRHSDPALAPDPFSITVQPDLRYPGWLNQPANTGVDLPRDKAYYRLGLKNKRASIREARYWIAYRWKLYKAASKAAWLEHRKTDPNAKDPCRGKSLRIPKLKDLIEQDATQERITIRSRKGVQVSMASDFANFPFKRKTRHTPETPPC